MRANLIAILRSTELPRLTSQSLIFRDHTLCKIPRHATGGDDDACRVLQLLRIKIRLNFVGVTSQSLIFRDHTLCKIPRHATGGDDDAYRVLQLLRLNFVSDLGFQNHEYQILKQILGGVRGGEAPPRTRMGSFT